MEALDNAPILVRILPGLLGLSIILYIALGGEPRVLYIVVFLLAGVVLKFTGGSLKSAIRAKILSEYNDTISIDETDTDREKTVFHLMFKDREVIPKIEDFLLSRSISRPDNQYMLVQLFRGGNRNSFLIVEGSGIELESEVLETALTSFLDGVQVRPGEGTILSICGSFSFHDSQDRIFLGYRLDSPRLEPLYLTSEDIVGHIGIFGSTGSGKSTTLRAIARRMIEKNLFSIIVFDWTGEHRVLVREGVRVVDVSSGEIPADILSCNLEKATSIPMDILSRALELTEPQTYLLGKIIGDSSSLKDLYERVSHIPEESKWDKEVKRALQRKLGLLVLGEGERVFSGCPIDKLLSSKHIVLDLSGIIAPYIKRLYVIMVLSTLFNYAYQEYKKGIRREFVLFLDEIHNLGRGAEIIVTILSEARKYGIHVVYATQSPSNLDNRLLLNTNTKIVHSIKSNIDKRIILDSLGLDSEWFQRIDKFARGTALLQCSSQPQPVLVEVKP